MKCIFTLVQGLQNKKYSSYFCSDAIVAADLSIHQYLTRHILKSNCAFSSQSH